MSFFVDIMSEDSFYENLTLGILKHLEANPCIKNVQLERRNACDRSVLLAWEQKHCCLLTEELRNFYGSTDGFLLTWNLEIAGEEFPIGRMEIKELSNLKRHSNVKGNSCCCTSTNTSASTSYSSSNSSSSNNNNKNDNENGTYLQQTSNESKLPVIQPSFTDSRCKLFELSECADCRVFLTYQLQPDQDEPSVWLYNTTTNQWYRLADNFIKYFRIMLVHLGLPLWQMCAVGLQLPIWLEQVYLLVGPHLLESTLPSDQTSNPYEPLPTNLIDPAVFRVKEQHQHNGAKQKTGGGAGGSTAASSSASYNARKKSSSHC
ncbi:PREDICTED: tubulin polyglutamylase complex subunit 2 [Ceratosolen solmsi marchali]|uniref:Tubulin polyglutamylase complex subunit 2 n=1 Tax=Ceratosolen solmsi marchali TaxID=326594 RepID=A0AAJ6YWZ5_9HYME|nr:PREDICTED: tubulin polyglutamylase complex subunit 2 [Ceratosolen solmsi marchali]